MLFHEIRLTMPSQFGGMLVPSHASSTVKRHRPLSFDISNKTGFVQLAAGIYSFGFKATDDDVLAVHSLLLENTLPLRPLLKSAVEKKNPQ